LKKCLLASSRPNGLEVAAASDATAAVTDGHFRVRSRRCPKVGFFNSPTATYYGAMSRRGRVSYIVLGLSGPCRTARSSFFVWPTCMLCCVLNTICLSAIWATSGCCSRSMRPSPHRSSLGRSSFIVDGAGGVRQGRRTSNGERRTRTRPGACWPTSASNRRRSTG